MSFKRLLYQTLFWRGGYFLMSFLLNVLFARYYLASGSSPLYYLINVYSFVLLIASFSMESGISFFLAKKEGEEAALAGFSLLWTVVASVLSLGLLKVYFHFLDADVATRSFGMTATTFIPGQLLITFFTPLFYARNSSILPNQFLLAVNTLLVLLILFAWLSPSTITPAVYLRIYFFGFIAQGLGLAILFIFRYGSNDFLSLPSLPVLRKIIHYSLVAFAANIVFFGVYRVDYWFVKKYCTAAELGNYIQVSKLGQMLLVIPGIFAGLVFSRTTLENMEALRPADNMPVRLARMARLILLLFCFLFLLVLLAGRPLIPAVFGYSFDQMYAPLLILLPGILCLSILTLLSAWFGGQQQPGVNLRGALAGLIVVITGDALLIPRYRLSGAAAVSSAGYFVCLLYSLLAFTKKNHIGLRTMLIFKKEDWRWLRQQATLLRRSQI